MHEDAPAKINLALHVVGRRDDGYHLLDSLVVFAGTGDRIDARHAPSLSLDVSGPFAADLDAGEDNLVLRAARALASHYGRAAEAALRLDKRLPVASGIGGGSADAAATLRLLARLWRVTVPDGLALALGADVPVCLAGRSARMGGVGETLSPAPGLPRAGLLLVNPGIGLSTARVFASRAPGFSAPLDVLESWPEPWPDAAAMARDLGRCRNDLQAPAIALCPPVAQVLRALADLPGCLLARMSGSGATCFGLFATPEAAEAAAACLGGRGWWCWGGGFTTRSGCT